MKKATILLMILAVVLFLGRPSNTTPDLSFSQRIENSFKKIKEGLPLLSHCFVPLQYSLGEVDPRFNLSSEEIINDIKKAENIWEKALSIELFQYQEGAPFKINFIFDERQERSLAGQELNQKLNEIKAVQGKVSEEYQKLLKQYKSQSASYKKEVNQYEKELNDYNDTVSYWNKKGGAPEEEYDKLQKEKKQLNKKRQELEKKRKKINALVKQINDLAQREKKIVENYNQEVITYKSRYGEAQMFDQGKYFGDHIDIYQFKNRQDLILVLAHELGHALHMKHVSNPHSIMYYLASEQDLNHLQPTAEDLSELKEILKKECPKLSF